MRYCLKIAAGCCLRCFVFPKNSIFARDRLHFRLKMVKYLDRIKVGYYVLCENTKYPEKHRQNFRKR